MLNLYTTLFFLLSYLFKFQVSTAQSSGNSGTSPPSIILGTRIQARDDSSDYYYYYRPVLSRKVAGILVGSLLASTILVYLLYTWWKKDRQPPSQSIFQYQHQHQPRLFHSRRERNTVSWWKRRKQRELGEGEVKPEELEEEKVVGMTTVGDGRLIGVPPPAYLVE